MITTTPETVADLFIQLVNAGDADSLFALFTETGCVDDWGRTFVGTRSMRKWSDIEFIGAHGQLSDITITRHGTVVTVIAQWTSNQHTGPSRFDLDIAAHKIASMTITEAPSQPHGVKK